jgi:hypothetical protein
MRSFKKWMEEKAENTEENPEKDTSDIQQPIAYQQNMVASQIEPEGKSWSAKKKDILKYWRGIPEMPIMINPVSKNHEGTTFDEDTIRITGQPRFIYSVLSKLKQFLSMESKETKLQLLFKKSERKDSDPSKKSYAFYIQVKERGSKTQ